MLVQGQDAAADRIASRIIATDDQEYQVAEKLHRRHIPRVFAMGEHGDQVALGSLVDSFVPQAGKISQALE